MDLTNELKDKVVVISGGSRGIGFAAVKKYLAFGAKVCFFSHYEETGKAAMEKLMAINPNYPVMTFHPNLCDKEELTPIFDHVVETWGKVNILVNNAGTNNQTFLHKLTAEEWKYVMDTNLNSMFVMSQVGVKHMDKKGGSAIVNTASVTGVYGSSMGLPYPVSKSGVIGLTKSLSGELASLNIRVNAVAPGVVNTAMSEEMNDMARKSVEGTIPLKRMAEADELADAILFLSSSAAGYITGQVLGVDGGYRPANTF